MTVTVCAKPDCVQCNDTYRALDKEGIDYSIVDLTENPSARDRAMGLGYLQAPVIVAGDQHWAGFRPRPHRGTRRSLTPPMSRERIEPA